MTIPAHVFKTCRKVADAGGRAYLVGGAVRDELLGREPKDLDLVVTGLTPGQLQSVLQGRPFVGKGFPVIAVNDVEVALARTERKTGDGHDDFQCFTDGVTLEEDLSRRDFTINAMARDPLTGGPVVDPFRGQEDIRLGRLRYMSPDAFREDPLRVFRAARFLAQLPTFRADTRLANVACSMNHMLEHLPGERVFGEMSKALRALNPRAFFDALYGWSCMQHWFPELEVLGARPAGPVNHHPEGSAFEHTMQVVTRCRELNGSEAEMYAALVHDLGKGVTPDEQLPHHYDHERLGVPLVHAMSDRVKVTNEMRELGVVCAREHLNIHRFGGTRSVKRVDLIGRLGRHVASAGLVSQADAQGRGPDYWYKDYPSRQALLDAKRVYDDVRGQDVLDQRELSGGGDGQKIAQKMRMARARAIKAHFGLKK